MIQHYSEYEEWNAGYDFCETESWHLLNGVISIYREMWSKDVVRVDVVIRVFGRVAMFKVKGWMCDLWYAPHWLYWWAEGRWFTLRKFGLRRFINSFHWPWAEGVHRVRGAK